MDRQLPSYRLVRRPLRAAAPPRLDDDQRRVVGHSGGPLLVLAGPGTGKTTTVVETVVDRVTHRGIDPGRVLVLTFSRKAAQDLRQRIALRLDRTVAEPLALTFHSYAYALVRREFVLAGDEPPILMSGPEQLAEVRRMLRGEAADGAREWPDRLRPAVGTRGFGTELRDFLLRAAERGMDGAALSALGASIGREDWVAAGAFSTRYAARFDLAPVPAYDYAEVVRLAGALLGKRAVQQRERDAYDVVIVDEYQDTDPAQEDLLLALAGDGRELIAVGDPDQSIYAFRGADSDAISRFPALFLAPDGKHARVIALRTARRGGQVLLAASRRVAARLPAVRGMEDPVVKRDHRAIAPPGPADPGSVRIVIAASARQEAAVIADTLRRAHLIDRMPWSSMAVLVRSATRQAPLLQRVLAGAGVPVAVAGDELPLTADPGTRPLLRLIECALRPALLTEEAAAELVTGPLGGTDPLGLRRLHRLLRPEWQGQPDAGLGGAAPPDEAGQPGDEAGQPGDEPPPPAGPLAAALRDPRLLTAASWQPDEKLAAAGPALAAARRVARLLEVAAAAAADGTAYEVLWAVWNGSGLAADWEALSAAGSPRGASADSDLDAVMTLFDAAARFDARMPPGSMTLFIDSLTGQEIVGDTLAERAQRGEAVTVCTAHRAKGLEWDLVVVAGVQEGTWPDLRQRGTLLGMDELVDMVAGTAPQVSGAVRGSTAASTPQVAAEAGGAGSAGVAAGAGGTAPAGPTPAGTAAEAGGVGSAAEAGVAGPVGAAAEVRGAGAAGAVAEAGGTARASTVAQAAGAARGGTAAPTPLAAAVALSSKLLDAERRLFYVAVTRAQRVLVVTAVGGEDGEERPSRFLTELAGTEVGIEQAATMARRSLSVPALTAELRRAAADARLAGPVRRAAAAQLARLAAAGVTAADPRNWYALNPWSGAGPIGSQTARVSPSQVDKFVTCGLRWLLESAVGVNPPSSAGHLGSVIHAAAALAAQGADHADIAKRIDEIWNQLDFGSAWYGARQRERAAEMIDKFLDWHRNNPRELIAVEQRLGVRLGQILITGQVDRLERDADGNAVVVDLKTGSSKPSAAELQRNPQLGVYQLAVLLGAFAELGLASSGGAELVQVGKAGSARQATVQRQRSLAVDPDPQWARVLVETVAARMPGPSFSVTANEGCRVCRAAMCCPVDERGAQVNP